MKKLLDWGGNLKSAFIKEKGKRLFGLLEHEERKVGETRGLP